MKYTNTTNDAEVTTPPPVEGKINEDGTDEDRQISSHDPSTGRRKNQLSEGLVIRPQETEKSRPLHR